MGEFEKFYKSRMKKFLSSDTDKDYGGIYEFLNKILPNLAEVATEVYNNWKQSESGESDQYGSGGICDDVASEMASEFDRLKGEEFGDWDSFTMYDEHACHTDMYIVNHDKRKIIGVYLPASAYESGGGYTWKKKKEHEIQPSSFNINDRYLDYENFFNDSGEMLDF